MYEDWIRQLGAPVDTLDRRGLCEELSALARLRAAADAREAQLLGAVDTLDDRGASASAVARSITRCSPREADRKARRAVTLARLPDAADALAEGALTLEHIDTLSRAVDATSPDAVAASGLIEQAARRPADLAAKDAREWTRRVLTDTDRTATHRRQNAARRLSIFRGDDGMTVLHAEFDAITGAKITNVITAETDRLYRADGGRDGAGGVRTSEQRRADALVGLLTGAAPAGDRAAPPTPPVRNQFIVLATADGREITDGRLVDGTPLPAPVLERLACGSDFFGAVFSGGGDPLWMGRRTRTATDAQWRMLVARDGGCGPCGADPARCEVHHLTPWAPPTNGTTDIDEMVLVCGHDHHLIHDHGYRLVRNPDGTWQLEPP